MNETPSTLLEAITYFSTGDNAHNFIVQMRWPKGVCCPRCQSQDVRFITSRKIWECKSCTKQKQFSVKVGTIMEDSPIPLSKWLAAFWLIANAKNGVSSYEIHRALGITQKSAWFLEEHGKRKDASEWLAYLLTYEEGWREAPGCVGRS